MTVELERSVHGVLRDKGTQLHVLFHTGDKTSTLTELFYYEGRHTPWTEFQSAFIKVFLRLKARWWKQCFRSTKIKYMRSLGPSVLKHAAIPIPRDDVSPPSSALYQPTSTNDDSAEVNDDEDASVHAEGDENDENDENDEEYTALSDRDDYEDTDDIGHTFDARLSPPSQPTPPLTSRPIRDQTRIPFPTPPRMTLPTPPPSPPPMPPPRRPQSPPSTPSLPSYDGRLYQIHLELWNNELARLRDMADEHRAQIQANTHA